MALLCLTATSAVHAGEGQAQSTTKKKAANFGFVGSGGIAAGAFQAGVVYTVLRSLIKQHDDWGEQQRRGLLGTGEQPRRGLLGTGKPQFVAATGASAGAINAFLAPILWSQWPKGGTRAPNKNVLWDTWVNVGWAGLLPNANGAQTYEAYLNAICSDVVKSDSGESIQETCKAFEANTTAKVKASGAFGDADGLLSRPPLPEGNLLRRLETGFPARMPENGINIGLTLNLQYAGFDEKLGVRQSTYLVPMRLTEGSAKAVVKSMWLPDGRTSPLFLKPTDETKSVSATLPSSTAGKPCVPTKKTLCPLGHHDLIRVITASGGYPLAFSPVRLSVKRAEDENYEERVFSDGGLYNNFPLGALIDLDKQRGKSSPLTVILVDPDPRRHETEDLVDTRQVRAAPDRRGLANVVAQGGSFVSDARASELIAYQRHHESDTPEKKVELIPFDRFSPVFGNMVGAFGAFFDRRFRRYDFFVGMYEAAVTLHVRQKAPDKPYEKTAEVLCAIENADTLAIGDRPRADFYDYLLRREQYWVCRARPRAAQPDRGQAYRDARERLRTQTGASDDVTTGGLAVVLGDLDDTRRRAILGGAAPDEVPGLDSLQAWTTLLHLLAHDPTYDTVFANARKNASPNSVFNQDYSPGQWLTHQALRALDRLLDVEAKDRVVLSKHHLNSQVSDGGQKALEKDRRYQSSRDITGLLEGARQGLARLATGHDDHPTRAHLGRNGAMGLAEVILGYLVPYGVGYRWATDDLPEGWEVQWKYDFFGPGHGLSVGVGLPLAPLPGVRPRFELGWTCAGTLGVRDAEGFQLCPQDQNAVLDRVLRWEVLATAQPLLNTTQSEDPLSGQQSSVSDWRLWGVGAELGVELASSLRLFGGFRMPVDGPARGEDWIGWTGGVALTNVNGTLYDTLGRQPPFDGFDRMRLLLPKRLSVNTDFDQKPDYWARWAWRASDYPAWRQKQTSVRGDGGLAVSLGWARGDVDLEVGPELLTRIWRFTVDLGAGIRLLQPEWDDSLTGEVGLSYRFVRIGAPRIGVRYENEDNRWLLSLSLASFGDELMRRDRCQVVGDAWDGLDDQRCERTTADGGDQ